MIGPGGLLLVVSHLFVVPVLVLWGGLQLRERWSSQSIRRNEGKGWQMVELSVEFVFFCHKELVPWSLG